MILSDDSIRDFCSSIDLIRPFKEENLQPASYDLTLGSVGIWPVGEPYLLEKGKFLLASTEEFVKLPARLAGRIEGKSSLARKGIIIHTTAGFVDPGFQGQLTLELSNLGEDPFPLEIGMRIAQIAFMILDKPAMKPYGHSDLDSHYQYQVGPTKSFLDT